MVASISACKDPSYYFAVYQVLYHLTGLSGAGIWYGEGARLLGFTGPVLAEQLISAFNGFGPDGYTRHVQVAPEGRKRQGAWDITFSVPKYVSALWAMLGDEDRRQIEELVIEASKRGVDYLESKALFTRRGKGGVRVEHAKGVYAFFPHGTSRSLDPQLHVHALFINMCVREDGTTGTIRSKDLYIHKMAAGALFRLELASLLASRLGLKISSDDWSFKLLGVPQSLCEELSKRREVIERIAKEEGWQSPRVLAQVALWTRAAKQTASMAECTNQWLETGERHSFGRREAERLLNTCRDNTTANPNHPFAAGLDVQLGRMIEESVELISTRQSYFAERDVIQQVAASMQASGVSANQLVDTVGSALQRFEHRVVLPSSDYCHYATTATLATERELVSIAENSRLKDSHHVSDAILAKAKEKVEKRLTKEIGFPAELTFDQHTALIHVTQECGGVKLIQGYAGTGKTQMLEAANLAWKQSGYKVMGVAVAGKAAVGLQNTTGIRSVTISKLIRSLRPDLTNEERSALFPSRIAASLTGAYFEGFRAGAWMRNPLGQALKELERAYQQKQAARSHLTLDNKTILVVDEAGMVPTKVMLALLEECSNAGAKLVLIGDSLQLPAIEAGGPFTSLCERMGCQYLTTIVRQRQEWMREASFAMVQNDPRHALDLYATNDCLKVEKSQRAAVASLVADYGKLATADYRTSLALTSTRAEAAQINASIQQRRLGAGQLGHSFAVLRNGQRVYENDRVMLTRNDYKLGFRNGILGTVVGLEQSLSCEGHTRLTVSLDTEMPNGECRLKAGVVQVDLAKYPDVQLAYAATTHKAQGSTFRSTYVLFGDAMLNKEMAFTQLTRASHQSIIYAAETGLSDTLDRLSDRLSRSTSKDLASDHEIVIRSQESISKRKAIMQEVFARLVAPTSNEATAPIAYLSDATLATSQGGALWQLIGHYKKLGIESFHNTIAIATDSCEVGLINNSVQCHRIANNQLGIDGLQIRQGETVYRGDRVLLLHHDELGMPRPIIGTAVGLGYADGGRMAAGHDGKANPLSRPWLTIQVDPNFLVSGHPVRSERITVERRDFEKLQLAYAATTDALKGLSAPSALILLPEQAHSSQTIARQLAGATKEVALFGMQTRYGPLLDEGHGNGGFLNSLNAITREDVRAKLASSGDEYKQGLEEQQQTLRRSDEQLQLAQQRSFQL